MKINKLNTFQRKIFTSIFLVVLLISCQKDYNLAEADRLFRPIVTQTEYAGTWIRYTWDMYEGVDYYELKLASGDTTNIVATAKTDTSFYTFENLNYDTKYYLLLKSHGENIESKFFVAEMVQTNDFPTQLTNVNTTSSAVKVNWADAAYAYLELALNDTVIITHTVTAEENKQGYAIISELLADMQYVVRAYDNEGLYKGKLSFKTKTEEKFYSTNIIDLRTLPSEEAYLAINQELFDQVASMREANDSLVTIVLNGGVKYNFPTTMPTAGFIMKTAQSLKGNAILEVTGNLDFENVLDIVEFNTLTFSYPEGQGASNYGGKYIINGSKAGSIDKLNFNNCEISSLRGVIRTKDNGLFMKNITFSNCIIDSINGYGVINVGVNYTIDTIKVINTTISNAAVTFQLEGVKSDDKDDNLNGLGVLHIENSSLIYADVLFRCGDVGQVTLLKNIFAGSNSGANEDGIFSPSYQLRGNFKSKIIRDNYTSADTKINDFDNTQMREKIKDAFANPETEDFSLTIAQYRNFIGDPRWW